MIEVRNIQVTLAGRVILDSINFEVKKGETLIILGKNGSGKTVLLKSLGGLISPSYGFVKIKGEDTDDAIYSYNENAKTVAAYVFQKGGLFDSMNLFENVAFGMIRKKISPDEVKTKVDQTLDRVGLGGSQLKLPSELSGGMQKRAGLARALCMDPEIVFYDDPTAGLDPVLTDSIADLLISIKNDFQLTSVVVTHDMKFAKKIADKIILLYKGKMAFYGTSEEFFSQNDPFARQFVNGETEGPIDNL